MDMNEILEQLFAERPIRTVEQKTIHVQPRVLQVAQKTLNVQQTILRVQQETKTVNRK